MKTLLTNLHISYRKITGLPFFNVKENPDLLNSAYSAALEKDIVIAHSFANFSWFDAEQECEDDVRQKLRLNKDYIQQAQKIIAEITKEAGRKKVITVGVHIRRGDRATDKLFEMGYRVPEKSYFTKAMTYFRKKYKDVLFIVTTDDRNWVAENFQKQHYPDVYLAPKNKFELDLALLIECNYVIQSVGTFSRWAAYLNGRESVHYRYEIQCTTLACFKLHNSSQSPYQKNWITMIN